MTDPRFSQGYRFDTPNHDAWHPGYNRKYNEREYWLRYQRILDRWTFLVFFILLGLTTAAMLGDFKELKLLHTGLVFVVVAVCVFIASCAFNVFMAIAEPVVTNYSRFLGWLKGDE